MGWRETLTECGALWKHDSHPKRPYALLTSGRISNEFVDCTGAIMHPTVIAAAAAQLAKGLKRRLSKLELNRLIIVGQMKGSVTLASRIAEELNAAFIWMEKSDDSKDKRMFLDPRFNVHLHGSEKNIAVLVEDVTTTGSTTAKSGDALRESGYDVLPYVLTLVNRSGDSSVQGYRVISCVDVSMQDWERDKNPFTKDGKEPLEPVRPKNNEGFILRSEM